MYSFSGISPNFHIHVSVYERFIYSQDQSTYIPATEEGRPILEICKSLKDLWVEEVKNWETGHYNSVLEITVSFLGIHKWEPDIYIGFSLALHLQCAINVPDCIICNRMSTLSRANYILRYSLSDNNRLRNEDFIQPGLQQLHIAMTILTRWIINIAHCKETQSRVWTVKS